MAAVNRRKQARVKPKQLTARIRAGDALHIGLGIDNLSVGGAFVRCNTVLPVGQKVKLEIQRPGAIQLLTFSGTVMSCISPAQAAQTKGVAGVGLKFDSVPPHLQAWLAEVVSSSPAAAPGASAGSAPALPVLLPSAQASQRGLPPVTAPRAAPPPPDADWDQQGTQTEIPAFVPTQELDASALSREVNALKELLSHREKVIAELKRDNQQLRQALEKYLSVKR